MGPPHGRRHRLSGEIMKILGSAILIGLAAGCLLGLAVLL
jgi:hypothetical protein